MHLFVTFSALFAHLMPFGGLSYCTYNHQSFRHFWPEAETLHTHYQQIGDELEITPTCSGEDALNAFADSFAIAKADHVASEAPHGIVGGAGVDLVVVQPNVINGREPAPLRTLTNEQQRWSMASITAHAHVVVEHFGMLLTTSHLFVSWKNVERTSFFFFFMNTMPRNSHSARHWLQNPRTERLIAYQYCHCIGSRCTDRDADAGSRDRFETNARSPVALACFVTHSTHQRRCTLSNSLAIRAEFVRKRTAEKQWIFIWEVKSRNERRNFYSPKHR